jgi:hypothetical protein
MQVVTQQKELYVVPFATPQTGSSRSSGHADMHGNSGFHDMSRTFTPQLRLTFGAALAAGTAGNVKVIVMAFEHNLNVYSNGAVASYLY